MKRLTKSTHGSKLFGVCSGIGEMFGVDPVLIRAIFALGCLCTPYPFGILYLILACIMPDNDI